MADEGPWLFPLPRGAYWWSSGYRSPHRPNHMGVDLAAAEGTPLVAPFAGIVHHGDDGSGAGRWVWVTATGGVVFKCFHLVRRDAPVPSGAFVESGELIGWIGNTGDSSGPHAHIERHDGGTAHWTDPTTKLRNAEDAGRYPGESEDPVTPEQIEQTAQRTVELLTESDAFVSAVAEKVLWAVSGTAKAQGIDWAQDDANIGDAINAARGG